MSPLRRRFCKPSLLERMSTPTDNDDGFPDDDLPSDYETDDLSSGDRVTTVALMEEDDRIREDLKRELILLSSVTDRGMYASREEADIMVDIITQLEVRGGGRFSFSTGCGGGNHSLFVVRTRRR